MLNLEPEIAQLTGEGSISAEAAGPLVAAERREIVSIYAEVRALAWIGVMLMTAGVGVIVSKHFDRIGPLAIAVAIGSASAGCYAYAVWRRASAGRGVLDESVLLLGALILSADAGYIEHQFHLLGSAWPRHFLLLAVVHGATAYFFDSAALLSLSIAALASWLGIERNVDTFFTNKIETAGRAFVCAAIASGWRFVNRRQGFERVFDHFIANLALWGGLILTSDNELRDFGSFVVVALAAATIAYGFRKRAESFVMYAYAYAIVAIDSVALHELHNEKEELTYMTLSTIVAIAGLFLLHKRYDRR